MIKEKEEPKKDKDGNNIKQTEDEKPGMKIDTNKCCDAYKANCTAKSVNFELTEILQFSIHINVAPQQMKSIPSASTRICA